MPLIGIKAVGFPAMSGAMRRAARRSLEWNAMHADAGHMLTIETHRVWRQHTKNTNGKNFRAFRAGRPYMRDRNRSLESVSYESSAASAIIGTKDIAATLEGHVARTVNGRPALAIPLSPPLTESEARRYNTKRVPGGFVITNGILPPGVYRNSKSRTLRVLPNGKKRRVWAELVKLFVSSVKRQPFSVFRPTIPALDSALNREGGRWVTFIWTGKFGTTDSGRKPARAGNPVVRRV